MLLFLAIPATIGCLIALLCLILETKIGYDPNNRMVAIFEQMEHAAIFDAVVKIHRTQVRKNLDVTGIDLDMPLYDLAGMGNDLLDQGLCLVIKGNGDGSITGCLRLDA